ncbi:MAG: glycosyltransferase [Verrucomicrobia bacterium]|nr:glycosyltransferase [Verrucomicrobiota bacterium]
MAKIFIDPTGQRQKKVAWGLAAVGLLWAILLGAFWVDLENLPVRVAPDLAAGNASSLSPNQDSPTAPGEPLWKKWWRVSHPANSTGLGPIRLAFLDPEDESARISLREHGGQITHVAISWWALRESGEELEMQVHDPDQLGIQENIHLLPILSNDESGVRQPEPVETLLRLSPERQRALLETLISQTIALGAPGLMIDWGEIDPALKTRMSSFLDLLSASLHQNKLELWMILPVGQELEVYDLETLSNQADRLVAMLHDETGEDDPPGPIASLDWFEGWLKAMMSYGRSEQWVISLGLHGYDWTQGENRAETMGFYDALARANWVGLPRIEPSAHSDQPHFAYRLGNQRHDVWFLDAVTLANQVSILEPYAPGGIGIWKLGLEDRDAWNILAIAGKRKVGMSDIPKAVHPSGTIGHVGEGDALVPYMEEQDGRRILTQIENDHWRGLYDPLPHPASVMHSGNQRRDQVALTFDDGPDPQWTPQILDILKEEKVPATFFVVGRNAESHPELIQRILSEGHELGSHTFTHPNLSGISDHQIRLELNATRRLLEGITGRSLLLFRLPYNADSNPDTSEELRPLRIAKGLGYVTIGQSVDSKDWERPGADAILEAVQAGRAHGQTILFHDAGGERDQTVVALPRVISYLRERGDQLVTVGTMLGMTPAETMPALLPERWPLAWLTQFTFWLWRVSQRGLGILLIATTVLLVLRMGVVWFGSLRPARPAILKEPLGVSVLLPAYNETRVLDETLLALARTQYPGPIEFIVVDDGSTDGTAEIAEERVNLDPRFRVLSQTNQGKAAALNRGIAVARYPWIVTLDADTHFTEGTLARLVAPLSDARVGAVSGRVRVGNRRKFLPSLQDLEYSAGFHLDRTAYARWNCITVVPGAVSAFRGEAIQQCGNFSEDTLAEDADLTLALHRAGWRIAYAPDAVALTEAPVSPATLIRQRRRWTYGTLQSIWKHRSLIFSIQQPALGWLALPSVLLTQTFLAVAVPLVDIGVLWALIEGQALAWLPWCLALSLGMDALPVAIALRRDRESWTGLGRIFWMRIIYRPLLALAVWAALSRALTGKWLHWKKPEKHAPVRLPKKI